MVIYTSWGVYINSRSTSEARIAAIDSIIDVLLTTALDAAGNDGMQEYYLDSGQSKVTVKYRSSNQVAAAISELENLKQIYVNRLNGRMIRNIPEQNLRHGKRWL